jgi:hypothetical protein
MSQRRRRSNHTGAAPATADLQPTGLEAIDRLGSLTSCTIQDYVSGVSEYVRSHRTLLVGPKKAAQIRLSNALGRAFADELKQRLPHLQELIVGERLVSGALRTVKADVSELHPLDGLRLAVELKPVNLAVGRAIWNRFGDLRTFAVNLHLKFPFAVVGGMLIIPTLEETGTKEAAKAEQIELITEDPETGESTSPLPEPTSKTVGAPQMRSTMHLIERAVQRLMRAGGRKTEGDAPHLLEGIAVVVYDPQTGTIDPDTPPVGSGLRWDEFIQSIAASYLGRFEAD